MTFTDRLIPTLLAAAVLVFPALAQQFNPPVADIQNAVNAGFTPTEWHMKTNKGMTSAMLEGKPVMAMNGTNLGYIIAVNDVGRMVELQTPGDRAITMPESSLSVQGGIVHAHRIWRPIAGVIRRVDALLKQGDFEESSDWSAPSRNDRVARKLPFVGT